MRISGGCVCLLGGWSFACIMIVCPRIEISNGIAAVGRVSSSPAHLPVQGTVINIVNSEQLDLGEMMMISELENCDLLRNVMSDGAVEGRRVASAYPPKLGPSSSVDLSLLLSPHYIHKFWSGGRVSLPIQWWDRPRPRRMMNQRRPAVVGWMDIDSGLECG